MIHNNFYPTGGKLCFFSPCIEQVQRTCAKLTCEGFTDIHTYECLQREMNVQYRSVPVLDLECLKHKVYWYILLPAKKKKVLLYARQNEKKN